MGFYIYLPLCQQVLDVSVSVVQQVISKQAHGMPFCRRILNCPTYLLGHMIVFIPVAPISYVALSSVILYPPKRICGAKNISSKQTCCFSLMPPEPAR